MTDEADLDQIMADLAATEPVPTTEEDILREEEPEWVVVETQDWPHYGNAAILGALGVIVFFVLLIVAFGGLK